MHSCSSLPNHIQGTLCVCYTYPVNMSINLCRFATFYAQAVPKCIINHPPLSKRKIANEYPNEWVETFFLIPIFLYVCLEIAWIVWNMICLLGLAPSKSHLSWIRFFQWCHYWNLEGPPFFVTPYNNKEKQKNSISFSKNFPLFMMSATGLYHQSRIRKRESFIFPAFSLVRVSRKDSLKEFGMAIRVVTDI